MNDTRITILAAASELLNSQGLAAITIRNVAGAANYGRSTVVHHFGDKEGLLDALHLVALGHFSATINDSQFEIYSDSAQQVLGKLKGLQADLTDLTPDHVRQPGIGLFYRFKREFPGFWTILRFRSCPNFSRDDLPTVWDQINALANGHIGAPIGPTVDMILHQLLSLHDWIASASPTDALRLAQSQPSVPYWLTVFDRD